MVVQIQYFTITPQNYGFPNFQLWFLLQVNLFQKDLFLYKINPQYDKRLFIELQVQYMKIASSEHRRNILCT